MMGSEFCTLTMGNQACILGQICDLATDIMDDVLRAKTTKAE
jgi:hypothetical protein